MEMLAGDANKRDIIYTSMTCIGKLTKTKGHEREPFSGPLVSHQDPAGTQINRRLGAMVSAGNGSPYCRELWPKRVAYYSPAPYPVKIRK